MQRKSHHKNYTKSLYMSGLWSVYFADAKYVDLSWECINRSQTHECGNWDEAAQFLEKEYINGIFVEVQLEYLGNQSWMGEPQKFD